MRNLSIPLALALSLMGATTSAGATSCMPVTSGPESKTQTQGFVGLNWTLGGSLKPELVIGVANTRTEYGGETTGAKLALFLDVFGGVKPSAIKLNYLNGRYDGQGEVGVGYSFAKSSPLLDIGASGQFVGAGLETYWNGGWSAYGTLHSLDKFERPNRTTSTSCPIT